MTRERVPLDWAATSASRRRMMVLADRTNDGALAETAFDRSRRPMRRCATAARSKGGDLEAQLPKAQAIRDRLKGK